jgi:hypothetical protein
MDKSVALLAARASARRKETDRTCLGLRPFPAFSPNRLI